MITYQPKIIKEYAGRLYNSADRIVFFLILVGMAAGGIPGYIMERYIGLIAGLTIGGIIGFLIGNEIAFGLKLRAQIALCQVQIEENTRANRKQEKNMDLSSNKEFMEMLEDA